MMIAITTHINKIVYYVTPDKHGKIIVCQGIYKGKTGWGVNVLINKKDPYSITCYNENDVYNNKHSAIDWAIKKARHEASKAKQRASQLERHTRTLEIWKIRNPKKRNKNIFCY